MRVYFKWSNLISLFIIISILIIVTACKNKISVEIRNTTSLVPEGTADLRFNRYNYSSMAGNSICTSLDNDVNITNLGTGTAQLGTINLATTLPGLPAPHFSNFTGTCLSGMFLSPGQSCRLIMTFTATCENQSEPSYMGNVTILFADGTGTRSVTNLDSNNLTYACVACIL